MILGLYGQDEVGLRERLEAFEREFTRAEAERTAVCKLYFVVHVEHFVSSSGPLVPVYLDACARGKSWVQSLKEAEAQSVHLQTQLSQQEALRVSVRP